MLEAANPTDQILLLKSCIGNRALGWDLMPPGTKESTFTNAKGEKLTYCGYHDQAQSWPAGTPMPVGSSWYAGLQYDGDTQRAYDVLGNLSTAFYPGAKCYEVAGFFWWQGDRDSYDAGLSTHYEANLVQLIKQLRIQYVCIAGVRELQEQARASSCWRCRALIQKRRFAGGAVRVR